MSWTNERIIIEVEARMTSTRLPGKVLMPAGGKPLLEILVERLQHVRGVSGIVIATTINRSDDSIAALAHRLGVGIFRGSEEDVLGRVCGALRSQRADMCVEITGDCPLMDPLLVEEAIAEFQKTRTVNRYVGNGDPHRSVPDGFDVQIFTAASLYELESQTKDPLDREHVSYGFYRPESGDRWKPRWMQPASAKGGETLLATLDYQEDYDEIRRIYEELSPNNPYFGVQDVIHWIKQHPEVQDRCHRVREKPAHV